MNKTRSIAQLESRGTQRSRAHADQLSFIKVRADRGNELACLDALACCALSREPLPDWATDALIKLVRDALDNGLYGAKGRGNTPIGRLKRMNAQEKRFWTVDHVVRAQGRSSKRVEHHGNLDVQAVRNMLFAVNGCEPFDLGRTDEAAFEAASRLFRGTFAQGSAQQMATAYRSGGGFDPDRYDKQVLMATTLYLLGYDINP